jgi:group I intron endonuclease
MKNTKTFYKNSLETKDLSVSVKPFIIYLDLVSNVKIIFKENKGKSGVYRWNNLITGASYVGSAVNLSRRFRDYFSLKFINKEILKNNSVIYKALLKYGYSNFNLEILEYCDKMFTIKREQYYIDNLKPEYNLCLIAGSSLGRITREETKLKLRNVWLNKQFAKSKYSTLGEFIVNSIDKKLNQSRLNITKLYK